MTKIPDQPTKKNRKARRAEAAQRRPDTRTRVEDYRAPPGHVALSFDFAGRPPSTLAIPAACLAELLERVGVLVSGKSYQEVLHLLGAVIAAADAGNEGVWNAAAMLGYWLALNHPAAGPGMRERLADAIALDGSAHLTLNAGHPRGIAFALSDRFCDLDQALDRAREAGVATFVLGEPRRVRPGGQA